jgi:hypothetical protein
VVQAATEKFSEVMSALVRNKAFVAWAGQHADGVLGYAIGMWNTAFLVRSMVFSQGRGRHHGIHRRAGGDFRGFAQRLGHRSDGKEDVRWQIGVPVLGTLISIPLGLAFI